MTDDFASIVLNSCFRVTREMSDLFPLINEHCLDDDGLKLKSAIGSVIFDIMDNIVKKIEEENPSVSSDVRRRIETYGRAF